MSSQFGGSENEKRMQEQFIFSTITFFGVLTILFLSLITCGKGRTPITSSAATKTKKPSKNVQDDDEQKSEKRKPSKKTENTMKTQSETLKTESSPASSAIAADSKLQKLAKKKTVATTQEGSELVTPLSKSETIELSNTQALSNATNQSSIRSTKEKKSTNIAAAADKNNNINKQKSNGPIKDTGLNANEIPSNRSLNTARQQQQPSTRAQSTQNTTHEESSQKQSQKHKSEDQVILPKIHTPPPPRDIERDKELAAKALIFIRARRAQNAYSNRERYQPQDTTISNKEVKEPEIRDNPDEHAQVLTDSNEDNDHPNENKKKSKSFPTIETPDIIPGEKIAEEIEIEKEHIEEGENVERLEKEESLKESKKKKNIKLQEGIYVPPEKRKFRPVSEIPADDLTIKREIKKKKKKKKQKKKKKKKSSDSSSEDNKNKK